MLPQSFSGQWIGEITGTSSGYCVINVDPDRPNVGIVQVHDAQPFFAQLDFTVTEDAFAGSLSNFSPAPAPDGQPTNLPRSGSVNGNIRGDVLTGTWQTSLGTNGTVVLKKREPSAPRNPDLVLTWIDFREWAFKEATQHRALIFRGHSNALDSLVTSFHRTGRRNLVRYALEDVLRLRRALEPLVGISYDIRDPFAHGALLNLGQHHGFPTPLLDWTESPFVAAFFSFYQTPKVLEAEGKRVRIFVFQQDGWPNAGVPDIAQIDPTFARLDLLARNNPRVIPQQSVNMFSNVADIEAFIEAIEARLSRRFLRRVDVPLRDRQIAMRDLDIIGITAGALFPGIEGACRALAEKWF
jgi:hypothetical protein